MSITLVLKANTCIHKNKKYKQELQHYNSIPFLVGVQDIWQHTVSCSPPQSSAHPIFPSLICKFLSMAVELKVHSRSSIYKLGCCCSKRRQPSPQDVQMRTLNCSHHHMYLHLLCKRHLSPWALGSLNKTSA